MKKVLPVIIILIIIGFGAYLVLSGGKVNFTGTGFNVSKTITNKSETFVGDLKAAIKRGIPFKCTIKQENMEGTGYMKNKKYYAEITRNGKEGYILISDNCMFTWDKGKPQGVKMCFDRDIWETEETGAPQGEVNCTMTPVSDSLFVLPTNVNFIDMDNPPQE